MRRSKEAQLSINQYLTSDILEAQWSGYDSAVYP